MRSLVVLVLLFGGDGKAIERKLLPPAWPGTEAVYMVKAGVHGGAACAVAPFQAYTAEHVVDGELQVEWGPVGADPKNPGEVARVVRMDSKKDIARLLPVTRAFPKFAPVAKEAQIGEAVLLVNDGWVGKDRTYFPAVIAGMRKGNQLVLAMTSGYPGSSGGCVLNAKGELVAIYQGSIRWPNDPGSIPVGYAQAVWGKLEDIEK